MTLLSQEGFGCRAATWTIGHSCCLCCVSALRAQAAESSPQLDSSLGWRILPEPEHSWENLYNAHSTELDWAENCAVHSPHFWWCKKLESFGLLQLGVSGAGGEAWGSMRCLSREGEEGKDWYKSCEKFCFSLSYLRGRELIQPTNGYRLVTDGANCIIHYDSDWNEIMEGNFLSHSSRSDESIYYSLSVYLWMQIEFGDSNWWNVRNIKLIRADRKRNYWVELASDFTIPCTGLSFD